MSLTLPSPGTTSRVLRHLRHIQPRTKVPGGKFANRQPSFARSEPKYVQPKDRIAFWNIAPGDEVRVTVGCKKVLDEKTGAKVRIPWEGIVATVDRERNLVWLRAGPKDEKEERIPKNIKHLLPRLKDPEKGEEGGYSPNTAYMARPIHYSNLQLKLPADLKLPKDVDKELNVKDGVYASKIVRTKASYDPQHGHFVWKRFAVVQGSQGVLNVEVPWKTIEGRERIRRDNHATSRTVDDETWIPWHPMDPIKLLPRRARTSPQAILRAEQSARQSRADNKDWRKSQPPEALATEQARQGTYAGFAPKRAVKPTPTPQPPTPAELVYMARGDAHSWSSQPSIVEYVQSGGKTFSALDYLDMTPIEGPADSKWGKLPAVLEQGSPWRQSQSAGPLSRMDIDSWPIELLMKDDLTNANGLRSRMRRWNRRQEVLKSQRAELDRKEKENVETLRQHVAVRG